MKKNKHMFSIGMANFTSQYWGKIFMDIDSLPRPLKEDLEYKPEKTISKKDFKKIANLFREGKDENV